VRRGEERWGEVGRERRGAGSGEGSGESSDRRGEEKWGESTCTV
jgi:hypothetical protein